MNMIEIRNIDQDIHMMIHADASHTFGQQLEYVHERLAQARREDFPDARPVFIRYFLSDAANQAEAVEVYLKDHQECAVSVVEQPLLDGTKVALWVYMQRGAEVSRLESGLWEAVRNGHRSLWLGNSFCRGGDSGSQTTILLERYSEALKEARCSLENDCIRTWIYVQNIDVNYAGMVRARREMFDNVGLNKDTHYIASTGIAGRNAFPDSSVILDAYAVDGLHPDQIRHLYGSTHLNPTHEYGVTFERGTAVDMDGCRRVFISGTASIDNKGQILYQGDVNMQTERLLENVSVLLDEAECGYEDVMSMIVYIRDIADYAAVREIFGSRFPDIPKVYLWAPVCRPGWLVEMECIAFKKL